MNKKDLLIICLIICIVCSLQIVSASEGNTDDTNSTLSTILDNDVITESNNLSSLSLPENNEILSDDEGSFSQLQDEINNNDNIILTKNYAYSDSDSSLKNGIVIYGVKTITGDGDIVIDAKNQARIFDIQEGATVTLNGITFINANADGHGGSIWSKGIVHIDNCKFIDSTANGGNGGSVFINGDGSTITNSYFEGNQAIKTLDSTGVGGAVFLSASNITVSHSIFNDNYAGLNGGAIGTKDGIDNCTVINCTVEHNAANGSAGGIGMQSTNFKMYNSTFRYNEAKGLVDEFPGNGGGIVLSGSDSYVYNSTFINNTANLNGGALYLTNSSSSNTNKNIGFELCTFTNNTAKRSGGAIYWNGSHGVISNSTFINNNATGEFISTIDGISGGGDGGAIVWIGSYGRIDDNCIFINNYAEYRGGAIFLHGTLTENCTNVIIDSSKFYNNIAKRNGGAIDFNRGAYDGTITNCEFNNNIAYRSAGAVFWFGTNGNILNSNFTDNVAYGIEEYKDSYGTLTYGGNGGAIVWTGVEGLVDNCIFIRNEAKYNNAQSSGGRGGAVYLQGSDEGNCTNTTFRNCIFESNIAGTNGGAIDWFEGAHNGLVDNITFINNTAKRNGGAIFWHGENAAVKNSRFINNRATGETLQYNIDLKYDDVIIVNSNELPTGMVKGKLYVLNYTENGLRVFKSYTLNDANMPILLDQLTTDASTISPKEWAIDQFFGGDGGSILWSGNIGLVYNCNFTDSNSARRGGGAYMAGSDYVTYNNCNFINCTSGTNGGGVDWLAGANYGKIYNCVFNGTHAARSAGAIYYDGWYGEMINVTIINARSYGGTLSSSKDGLVNYACWDSSHWDTNTTGGDAGAIMFIGNHEYLYNVTFQNCTSQGRGGAVFLQDNSNITFELCYFENNEALGIATNVWDDYKVDYDGQGYNYKLTGHGGAIAFDVGAHDSTIKNSQFINNYARRDGGAINLAEGAFNTTIENSIFINNSAGDDGGAINWEGDMGLIKNITFYNNTGIAFNDPITGASTSKGGTICLTGDNVTITDSNFTLSTILYKAGKKDETDAGAIFLTGDGTVISNSYFTDCYSPNHAGAIKVIGNHTLITNCTFENCNATEDGGVLFVSGVYCKLYNSTFTNNFAGDDGGAINWEGNHGIIYNITCFNNRGISLGTSSSNGGTICLTGDNVTIVKSNFTQTSALIAGGAIFITGNNVNVTDSVFERCAVSLDIANTKKEYANGGGSIYVLGNYSNIENCIFTRSNARQGGVIYIQGHDVIITHATTDYTYAPNGGGAIFIKGLNATIAESNFTRGNSTSSNGGSIYIEGANAKILKTNFTMSIASKNGGAIYVNGLNTTIENSKFAMNNATWDGGSIYVEGENTTISDSIFIQSNARNGGAIYINGANAMIENSTFNIANAITHGGAIYLNGANSKVNNTNITRTTAKNGGAIYIQAENVVISQSHVTMSNATTSGGAIYISGINANIIKSSFNETYSLSTQVNNGGGAIYISGVNATVKESNFSSTHASLNGGAIYIEGNYATIDVSRFNSTSASQGGVIYLKGSYFNVTNSSFDNAHSYADGGVMYSYNSAYSNVINCNFTNNIAEYDGGSLYWQGGANSKYNTVDGCIFINNTAHGKSNSNTKGGGAIYWSEGGSYGTVKNSKFINNSAQTDVKADGGAILWDKSYHGILDNCTFEGNFVTSTATYQSNNALWIQGGALFLRAKANFTISNCLFKDSWSDKEAGAIYLSQDGNSILSPVDILVINTTFINNTAKANGPLNVVGGGAVLVKTAKNIQFVNVTFINNTANYGGALNLYDANANTNQFINCTFIGNDATIDGGSIWANKFLNLYNVTISNSTANHFGGGLFLNSADASHVLTNVTFINNYASNGGGIYWDRQSVKIEGLTFINNSAEFGGAIYIPKDSTTVSNNNFVGNTANIDGGAIYVNSKNNKLTLNNFTNNSAQRGGAIYLPISNNGVDISYSSFVENKADLGGAIYDGSQGFTNWYITYCNFTRNTANLDGGAIYLANNNQHIGYCIFEGNNATRNGGAVYVQNSLTAIIIHDSTFKNSHADNGGAIYNAGSSSTTLTINNDTFIKNIAVHNGGALYYMVTAGDIVYRDYNNFDERGIISSTTGRTDLYALGSSTHFIVSSLFEDNEDYLFHIKILSEYETPTITVELINPVDVSSRRINVIVNLTNSSGALVQQINVSEDNYYTHYNPILNILYVTFNNLLINETYNISMGFSNEDYLYKSTFAQAQAHGSIIGQFQLLQRQIEEAIRNGDDYYILSRSYTFTPYYSNGVQLDHSCMNLTNIEGPFTIYGNGWALDAQGYSRIFNITASNITFVDVEFLNGNASGQFGDNVDKGGAIYWAGENGQLIDSVVYNNYAEFGGGIYYNSSALNSKIINTTFMNNTAEANGGAIDCNAPSMYLTNSIFDSNHADYGAALCREVNASGGSGFNNTFINNYAETAGAALAWMNASNIHIDSYYFYNNSAGYSGGAIYIGKGGGNCEIENCIFEGNYVNNSDEGHGGAIEWYAEKGYVSNSSFKNNYAYNGGAIYVGTSSGKINITSSDFYSNYAITSGGAISLDASAVTIRLSNFYDNYAENGGALYVGGEGQTNYVYDSVFYGNNATNGNGGAINWIASSGSIINSNLTSNHAYYGGAIYFGGLSSESSVSHCILTDNHAKYNGGAIDCNSSKMNLTDTIFDSNYAQYGAALCREVNAVNGFGISNTFINNHAYISGAALAWLGSVGIKITDYKFINNSADVSGGAIYVSPESSGCSIIDSQFEYNYVTNKTTNWDGEFNWIAWDGTTMQYRIDLVIDLENEGHLINKTIQYEDSTVYYYIETPEDLGVGGAINYLASNATLINTNFTGNYARLGGALYVGSDSGNTNITNNILSNNMAYERGGAVNLHASAVNVDQSKFYNNVAENGGALYVGGIGTDNTIKSSVFEGNNASNYGAGVYWIAHHGIIDNINFTNNRATYGGGIFFNGRSANTNVTNVIFKSNNAIKNGGAIECNASNIGIYNITFDSNYAGEYGAALCREEGAIGGNGYNNTFISNHAEISGAGLAWLSVKNINIDHYTFIDNTAKVSGAAIYIAPGSDNAIINNSVFTRNSIISENSGHGGAIDAAALNTTIINSNFTENSAYYAGAVWFDDNSGISNITNSIFTRNTAVMDGGAINLRGSGITIQNDKFYENTAGANGGALYAGLTGKTSIIFDSVFENNKAGDHGGAIDWRSQAGEIKYSNFTENSAVSGGAIYLNGVSSGSEISHVLFVRNAATENGGAIDCNATLMNLTHTLFISNTAAYGAALCREANATGGFGLNNTFIANHATISGAALAWLDVNNININNYTFINNTAEISGGAIYVSENSGNCAVRNSTFENNYVTDVRNGRGGAIDWLGPNAYIEDTIFKDSLAVNGGTIYVGVASDNFTVFNSSFISSRALGEGGSILIYGDDAKILSSNFTFSLALEQGGAISAHNIKNITINDSLFDYSVGAGYVDSSLKAYGEGGAIYIDNSKILIITNSQFFDIESHSNGGAISAINCNDSLLYNLTFDGEFSIRDGGAISWIDSNNVTIDSNKFINVSANNGGAIYLSNIVATVKNSSFKGTSTPRGNGGAIYVDGNVTLENNNFTDFSAYRDYGGALYFDSGNSSVLTSFFNGDDAIWIGENATVYLTENNITGQNPNKYLKYLENDYDSKYNPVDYSVWNDGNMYLDKNNFDYLIFNNGTIWTNTTTKMLDNLTWEVIWNENFTYWAEIKDDNNNSIISVSTLNTYNDVYQDAPNQYLMPYNRITLQSIYQGVFHLYAEDIGLKQNTVIPGALHVKMPLKLELNHTIDGNTVTITAKFTPEIRSNYTITGEQLTLRLGDNVYYPTITAVESQIDLFDKTWIVATATFSLSDLASGNYKVTASYAGDDTHLGVENSTSFDVDLQNTWIKVVVENIVWGQYAVVNVTTNANGTVLFSMNGRTERINIANGKIDFIMPDLLEPGNYSLGLVYLGNEYFNYALNSTNFTVFKQNTTIDAVSNTPIIIGDNLLMNVTVNENATEYIKLTIANEEYVALIDNGVAKFNITNVPAGDYENMLVVYNGDIHFNGNETTVTFHVKPGSDYPISVSVENITYGENATISVILPTSASGKVAIYVDGILKDNVTITDGIARIIVEDLTAGSHEVNVTYYGDNTYASKDKNGTVFNVNPTDKYDFDLQIDASKYGENTTITIKVPENAAKNVTVNVDGVNYTVVLTNGEGNLTLNNISSGVKTVTAYYPGDENYTAKTVSETIAISQATSYIIIDVDAIHVGENATINITLSGNATGYVTVYVGSQVFENKLLDENHKVQVNVTDLPYGTHNVVVFYKGDNNYTSNVNSTTVSVNKIPTSISITVDNEYYVDESFNITVENTTAVNITINGKSYTIVNGNITINANELSAGHYIITAIIYEDDKYAGNLITKEFDIIKHAGEVTIEISGNNPHAIGSNFTITVTNNTAVNITVNGKSYNVNNGKVVINTADLTIGEYIVIATIYENDVYLADITSKTFNIVRNASDLNIVATPEVVVGKNTTITVTMINVTAGKVIIEVNKHNYTVDIQNGVATLNIALPVGNYTAHAYFLGDEKYTASDNISNEFKVINKTLPKVNITAPVTVEIDNNITFTANTTSNATLIVKVNGEIITEGADGKYHYNATVAGNYTITAEVVGNDYYFAESNTTIVTAYKHASEIADIVADPTSVFIGKNTTITVTMTGNETGKVLIEINGHNYTVTINDEHKAILIVALPAGNYTAKAYYLGDDKYNSSDRTSQEFNVTSKKEANITIAVPEVTIVGNNVTISITNSTPVNVTLNGEEITLVNGNYTFNATVVGNYTVIVRSAENDEYYAGFNSTVFNVIKRNATVNIIIDGDNVIEIDNNITFSVNTNSDGILVVKVNNKIITAGTDGKYHYNGAVAGNYTITAEVASNGYYSTVFNSTTFKVIKHQAKVNITVENKYEIETDFNIKVGNNTVVNVTINGKSYNVTNGKVEIDTTKLEAGKYNIIATIFENDKYYGNVANKTFEIFKHAAIIEDIEATPEVILGNNVTVTVTMNNVENGTVLIEIDGHNYTVEFTNKVAELNVTLPVGNYTVRAYFIENDKYNATSSEEAEFKVIYKLTPEITITAPKEVKVGETVNITVSTNGYNLTVWINGVKQDIIDGNISYTVTNAGINTIYAVTTENETVYAATKTVVFEGIKNNATLIIGEIDVVKVGDEVTITIANVTDGEITVKVDGVEITDGKFTPTASGNYTITVESSETGKYYAGFNTTTFNVVKNNAPVNISVNKTYYVGEAFEITITNETVVNVTINGKEYAVVDGKISISEDELAAGHYFITATIMESDRYNANSTTKEFDIIKVDSTVKVSVNSIYVGGVATITINVPSDIDGTVKVNVNGTNYTVDIAGGEGKLDLSDLDAGTYDINVTYIENGKYLSSSNKTELTVSKLNTKLEVSVQNTTLGKNAIINVTVEEDATGNVTITIDGKTYVEGIVNGKANFIISDLAVKEYDVEVKYNGDGKYFTNSTTVKLNVAQSEEYSIDVVDNGDGTLTVTVPGNASGNVTVNINGTNYTANVTNGKAVVNISNATPGLYNATVEYSGDKDHTAKSTTVPITVPKYATEITIDVDNYKVGQSIKVIVNVPEGIKGEVTIEIDGLTYSKAPENGQTVFEITDVLIAGDKTVTATYAGDELYLHNATTKEFTVSKNNAPFTITAEAIDDDGNVRITVSELPSDATGYVVIDIEGKEYAINISSTNQTVVKMESTGSYTAKATYIGDYKYLSNTSSATFKASKSATDVSVEVNDTYAGDEVTVKVTVPDDATGNITVKVGNTTKTVPATGGENIITVSGVGQGTQEVNVTYDGDTKYESKTIVKTVTLISSINADENLKRGWNSPYDFEAEFLAKDGSVLQNIEVKFEVNGKTYTVRTDSEGIARLTDSHLAVGTHEVKSINTVTGEEKVRKVTIVKRLIENKDITMDFVDGTFYKVKVIGDDGNPVGAGEFIAIKVNGVTYAVKTDAKGYASLKINLNPKSYIITAEYKNTKVSNKLKVKQTLKLVKKTVTIKKGKKLVLKAKLKWSNGKAIKGKVIKFKFKGKTYKAKTNSKGIAKVTIKKKVTKKLKKGKKYKFTAKYLTNTVKGKVKIKK